MPCPCTKNAVRSKLLPFTAPRIDCLRWLLHSTYSKGRPWVQYGTQLVVLKRKTQLSLQTLGSEADIHTSAMPAEAPTLSSDTQAVSTHRHDEYYGSNQHNRHSMKMTSLHAVLARYTQPPVGWIMLWVKGRESLAPFMVPAIIKHKGAGGKQNSDFETKGPPAIDFLSDPQVINHGSATLGICRQKRNNLHLFRIICPSFSLNWKTLNPMRNKTGNRWTSTEDEAKVDFAHPPPTTTQYLNVSLIGRI